MRNANLTFITNAIKAAGGTLPPVLATALADAEKITTHIRDNRSRGGGYVALATAWTNAVLDGRDPAEDREVFRSLLADAINGGDIDYAANNAIDARTIAGLEDEQGTILAMFKKAFDEAGRVLRNAHGILGNIRLDDTTTIFQLGTVAVQAHQGAQEARRTIRVIDQGWLGLNSLTGFAGGGQQEPATRWTDSDIDTWERVRRSKDGWEMTIAGATLDLAIDRDTITQRQQQLSTERNRRDNAPDNEKRSQLREQGARTLANVEAAKASMR